MHVDDDSLVLSLTERNSCYPLTIVMARRGGEIDCRITDPPGSVMSEISTLLRQYTGEIEKLKFCSIIIQDYK